MTSIISDIVRAAIEDVNSGKASSNVRSPEEIETVEAQARKDAAERQAEDLNFSRLYFDTYLLPALQKIELHLSDFTFGSYCDTRRVVIGMTFGKPERKGWRREGQIFVTKREVVIQAMDIRDYTENYEAKQRATRLEIADITIPGEAERAVRHIALLAAEGPELPDRRKRPAPAATLEA